MLADKAVKGCSHFNCLEVIQNVKYRVSIWPRSSNHRLISKNMSTPKCFMNANIITYNSCEIETEQIFNSWIENKMWDVYK